MVFKNDIRKLTAEDYSTVLSTVLSRLSVVKFVVSVYKFGSVKFPGVSDIDLLVVIDNDSDYEKKRNELSGIIKNVPNADYIFFHESIVISSGDIRYVSIFHSLEDLVLISGQDLFNVSGRTFGEEEFLMWNSYFYKTMLYWKNKKKIISVRYALLLANNMLHCIKNNDFLLNTEEYVCLKVKSDGLRKKILESDISDEVFSGEMDVFFREILRVIDHQESLRYKGNFRLYCSIDVSERVVYVSIAKIFFLNLYFFKVCGLPPIYFEKKSVYKNKVSKLFKHRMGKFFEVRRRYCSVKFMDF